MKLMILGFALLFVLLIGGFIYLAIADVPVEKAVISKTISNERFFNAN